MLWFRAEEDFKDWLNNPYHTQAQRNFLIKLAVNFVHDLYKPNVRGYQVTQSRVKPYGNKMVRQFKLERWMDYGPTIAAAFGSYEIKEVEDLRKAIVECMRNTPLENGIKATGAVQQQPQQPRLQQHPHNGGGGGGGGDRQGPEDGYGQNNGPSGRRHTMGGKYPMEGDILFFQVPSQIVHKEVGSNISPRPCSPSSLLAQVTPTIRCPPLPHRLRVRR
jgi:hypothetical protein